MFFETYLLYIYINSFHNNTAVILTKHICFLTFIFEILTKKYFILYRSCES